MGAVQLSVDGDSSTVCRWGSLRWINSHNPHKIKKNNIELIFGTPPIDIFHCGIKLSSNTILSFSDKFGNQYDSQFVTVQSVPTHKPVQSSLLTYAANLKPEFALFFLFLYFFYASTGLLICCPKQSAEVRGQFETRTKMFAKNSIS